MVWYPFGFLWRVNGLCFEPNSAFCEYASGIKISSPGIPILGYCQGMLSSFFRLQRVWAGWFGCQIRSPGVPILGPGHATQLFSTPTRVGLAWLSMQKSALRVSSLC